MLQRPISLHFHHLYFAFLYFVPSCFHGLYDSIRGAKINIMEKMMSLFFHNYLFGVTMIIKYDFGLSTVFMYFQWVG